MVSGRLWGDANQFPVAPCSGDAGRSGIPPIHWERLIAITTGNKWEKVWVEPEDLRSVAATGYLPATWDPSQGALPGLGVWSIARSGPSMKNEPGERVADWFDAALRELHEAGLVEPYHRELQAKMQAKLEQSGAAHLTQRDLVMRGVRTSVSDRQLSQVVRSGAGGTFDGLKGRAELGHVVGAFRPSQDGD